MYTFLLIDDLFLAIALTGFTAELLQVIRFQALVKPYEKFSNIVNLFVRPANPDGWLAIVGWMPIALAVIGLVSLLLVWLQLTIGSLLVTVYGLVLMMRIQQYYGKRTITRSSLISQ